MENTSELGESEQKQSDVFPCQLFNKLSDGNSMNPLNLNSRLEAYSVL